MPKFKHRKGGTAVFSDEILEKIYGNKDAEKIPFGYLSDAIRIVSNAVEEVEREKVKDKYADEF
mgnify:CR=1 FL=1